MLKFLNKSLNEIGFLNEIFNEIFNNKCCFCEKTTDEKLKEVYINKKTEQEHFDNDLSYHESCLKFYLQNFELPTKTHLAIRIAEKELDDKKEAKKLEMQIKTKANTLLKTR
jgi:predicted nucleic acid-binding protein